MRSSSERAQAKYQHKRQLRLDYLNKQLQAEQHSAQVFEDVDVAMREYWLVTGGDESKLKAVPEGGKEPELSDYYSPSETQKLYKLAFYSWWSCTDWLGSFPLSLGLKK